LFSAWRVVALSAEFSGFDKSFNHVPGCWSVEEIGWSVVLDPFSIDEFIWEWNGVR
jgi:hypothetical protein